jgi:hypothetical protein
MSAEEFLATLPKTAPPPPSPSPVNATYQQVFYYLPPKRIVDRTVWPAPLDPYGLDLPLEMPEDPPVPADTYTTPFEEPTFLLSRPNARQRVRPLGAEGRPRPGSRADSLPSYSRMGPDHPHFIPALPPHTRAFWDQSTPRTAAALYHLQDPILMDGELGHSVPRSVLEVTGRPTRLPSLEGRPSDGFHRLSDSPQRLGPFGPPQ